MENIPAKQKGEIKLKLNMSLFENE